MSNFRKRSGLHGQGFAYHLLLPLEGKSKTRKKRKFQKWSANASRTDFPGNDNTIRILKSISGLRRRYRDGRRRTSALLQLQDDRSHSAHILRVLGGLGIEVAQLGDPLPLRAGHDGVLRGPYYKTFFAQTDGTRNYTPLYG